MRMHFHNEDIHYILLIPKLYCWEEHKKLEMDAYQIRNLSRGEPMQQNTFKFKL